MKRKPQQQQQTKGSPRRPNSSDSTADGVNPEAEAAERDSAEAPPQSVESADRTTSTPQPPGKRWRYARSIGSFLGVLLVATLLSWGVYTLRLQMESVSEEIYAEFLERSGLDIESAEVSPYRLRGIRLSDVEASWTAPDGSELTLAAPEATLEIDLGDLLAGAISLERFHLEAATLHVAAGEKLAELLERPSQASQEDQEETLPFTLPTDFPFRVTGSQCAVEVTGVKKIPALRFAELDFDTSLLSDARDIQGRVSGVFDTDEAPLPFDIRLRYARLEDFDLRLELGAVGLAHVTTFYPALEKWIASGSIQPALQLSSRDGEQVQITLQAHLAKLRLQDQTFLQQEPSGDLAVLATYQFEERLLQLQSAQANTTPLGGQLSGSIAFVEQVPELNLQVAMQDLPMAELLNDYAQAQWAEHGALQLALEAPHELNVDIVGPLTSPDFAAQARVAAGNVDFKPADSQLPEVDLDFTQLHLDWLGQGDVPELSFNLAGGQLYHAPHDVAVEHIYGNVRVLEDRVIADGLRAELFNDVLAGNLTYHTEARQVEFELRGALHNIEELPEIERIPKTYLSGSAALECSGVLSTDRYLLDLNVDATQTDIEYDWWFHKVPGMGANLNGVQIEVLPEESIEITGDALLDTTPLSGRIQLEWNGERWWGRHARVQADTINVMTAGKCIRTPYTFRGPNGQGGAFEWRRLTEAPETTTFTLQGFFEEGAVYPDGVDTPVQARNLKVETTYTKTGEDKSVQLEVKADSGRTPSMTRSWIQPIRPEDPDLEARFPRQGIPVDFQVQVDELALLPWEGREFSGHGYVNKESIHIDHFEAKVGEGDVQGMYSIDRIENVVMLDARWNQAPSRYLLAHLNLPAVLDGPNTGEIDFSYDRDDPQTLQGRGRFNIEDGQFSADYLAVRFEEYLLGDNAALPPSLSFSLLRSDIELEGDQISTPNMLLVGEGVTITGGGHFYQQGDMLYDISASVSPETAEQIPLLRENFNIEGHRLTQNDIVLGFHISGPLFNPQGELAGLPGVGVTLVSGAGQVTNDVFNVITAPGQILLDLLKMGGSIVGAPR